MALGLVSASVGLATEVTKKLIAGVTSHHRGVLCGTIVTIDILFFFM